MTITFIAGFIGVCAVIAIRNLIATRGVEDTLLGVRVITRPPIRIHNTWEVGVALALTKGGFHVLAILAQALVPSTAGVFQPNTTAVVAREQALSVFRM